MQGAADLEMIHLGMGAITLGVTALLAYLNLKTKYDVSESKNELIQGQTEIAGKLQGHIENDEIKHKEFDRRLDNLDNRVKY